jgi:poly(beta-D-mannuronate) lyase
MILLVLLGASCAPDERPGLRSADDVARAMKTARPGDTLLLAAGTWKDQVLVLQGRGTEREPIVVRSAVPGGAVFTGSARLRISGEHLVVEGLHFKDGAIERGSVIEFRTSSEKVARNCRLTNTVITAYNPANDTLDYKWVSLYGERNRVDHCTFVGKRHQGCLLVVWLDETPDHHRIDSNAFCLRPPHWQNGAEIIRVGTSEWSMRESFTTVEQNFFYRCDGEHEVISNKSCRNVYRGNTFVECQGALVLRHGNDNLVDGNFFFGNGREKTGGVRVIGERQRVVNNYFQDLRGTLTHAPLSVMMGVPNSPLNAYFQVADASIAFNTFVNCRTNLETGIVNHERDDMSLPPVRSLFANNLIASPDASVVLVRTEGAGLACEGNVVDGDPGGASLPAGFTEGKADLRRSLDSLWRPVSPPSGAGEFAWVTTDMDGQARPAAKHVGADEPVAGPVLRRPMTWRDTGAPWFRPSLETMIGAR